MECSVSRIASSKLKKKPFSFSIILSVTFLISFYASFSHSCMHIFPFMFRIGWGVECCLKKKKICVICFNIGWHDQFQILVFVLSLVLSDVTLCLLLYMLMSDTNMSCLKEWTRHNKYQVSFWAYHFSWRVTLLPIFYTA